MRALLPLLAATLALAGCAQAFDTTTLGVPVSMAAPVGIVPPDSSQRFSVTSRQVYGLWGAVKLKEVELDKLLASQLVGQSGVADLRIKVRSKFTDVLLTILTAGLIVPRAVTFEGVVVNAAEVPALPAAGGPR